MQAQNQIKRTLSAPEGSARLQELMRAGNDMHRTALAERVCAEFGFLDARGRYQRSGCLKALRELERAGRIALPGAVVRGRAGAGRPRRLGEAVAAPQGVPNEVGEVQGLVLVRVDDAHHRAIWNELMAREHPRGVGPLVGCQLRYLVGSAHGWLGAVGVGAAALRLAAREHWIGWDAEQRRAQLHRLVGLSRFLIRPGVACRNLASHVLGRVVRVLGEDFEARFGYRPWLVETFVETPAHSGVSLRAANWLYVGETCGRGRQDRQRAASETRKAIYVYALERDWRTRLGVGPAPRARHAPLGPAEGLESASWAEQEFGDAPLGDRRLSKRLVTSARYQAEDPMRAFTAVAKSDWAAAKGYYRLIDQPADSEVSPENILRPHRERTVRRMQAQQTVLCIQDGTDLRFATRPETSGLGVIGSNQTGAKTRGLHLHSSLVVSTEGLPLGVLRAECTAPEPKAKAAREDKKSFRWIEGLRDCAAVAREIGPTRVVSVMDREADFFELFVEQRAHPVVEVLVRAKHNRRLSEAYTLFEKLRHSPVRGNFAILVGRQSARPKSSRQQVRAQRAERSAQVALRYEPVELRSRAPEHRDMAPIGIWVVHVREEAPPPRTKPLEWFLLTTVPVTSAEQAETLLSWYCLRWRIEDWHRVLKSGCRVQELQHQSAERLERALAIHLVIAWRIMLMTLLGRETTELPAELLFSDLEIQVLSAFAKSRGLPTAIAAAGGRAARVEAWRLPRPHTGSAPPGTS